ncbi:MAG: sulfotransferase [Planctomycetota bacterium]
MSTLTQERLATGSGLAFVLGAYRSGTTLLRKVLDSHPAVVSPAETWFLLPLMDLWEGRGSHPTFRPAQATAAMKNLVDAGGFARAAGAFAGSVYAQAVERLGNPGTRVLVDKTPLYTNICGYLPTIFPDATFLVLARDPRSIAWSRHTWRHATSAHAADHFGEVAKDIQTLAAFAKAHDARSHVVRYEELCEAPERTTLGLCGFLGVDHDASMIDYGSKQHHEGYGDENTRQHTAPHAASLSRWAEPGGMTPEDQRRLLDLCGRPALEQLGYPGLGAARLARSA